MTTPVALTPFMLELNRRYESAPKLAEALRAISETASKTSIRPIGQSRRDVFVVAPELIEAARAALAEYGEPK